MGDVDQSLDESGITMVDLLKEEEDRETEAAAVLGAGDDTVCTYGDGYMKRQPLYSCLTCCITDSKGGICLGCSYHCHEGHDLVELYTKRNFRCDCGNSKFSGSNSCKLQKDKDKSNDLNKYNHNFEGKYCTCSRPYPDPEDTTNDQMIQCILCEDWYHGKHLGVEKVADEDAYEEMICHKCSPKLTFIGHILHNSAMKKEEADVDIASVQEPRVTAANLDEAGNSNQEVKDLCMLDVLKPLTYSSGAVFLTDGWREKLCRCDKCKEEYGRLDVLHLIDFEDTVSHYESKGLAKKRQGSVEREMDALSSLDRVTMGEVVHEYNNLSNSLRDYLKKFAENGTVVRGEDINEFFTQLKANKKPRNEVPYYCK